MIFTVTALACAATGLIGVLAFRVSAFARTRPVPTKSDAIVVLGARVLPSGAAAPALLRRAEKAAELYRQGLAPVVVFSGGRAGAPRRAREHSAEPLVLPSEARVARDIAVGLGVPAEACVLEENSYTTFENAEFTAPLLRERKIAEVVLVSDGYHLLRATLQFSRVGIRSQAVASERTLSVSDDAYWAVREAIALLRRPGLLWR